MPTAEEVKPAEIIVVKCSVCALERKTKPTPAGVPRTPKGWKNHREELYCADCWRKQHVLRAVTMVVASPEDGTPESWKAFRGELKVMWIRTTRACNWMMTQLYTRDVQREEDGDGKDKMPPMPPIDDPEPAPSFYLRARGRFPGLPSRSVASLVQTVAAKYRAKRYDVIWTCAASLPTYRYPTPFPIPNQGWTASIEDEKPIVRAVIGDRRYELRLKGGKRFHRQLVQFRQIASGEAIQGEMALMKSGEDDRDISCKLVAWLPRRAGKLQRTGTLKAHSASDNLLVALNEKDEKLWVYNADHLPRWAAGHRAQLQRWSEDQKAEHRPVPPFADRRSSAAKKYNQRMASACHEIAAMLVGYADRRRFAAIRWDDSNQTFAPQFPWFRLRELIKEKADAAGIAFEHVPGGEDTQVKA